MTDIYNWSTTAADNDDADATINWTEGQAPGTVNNSARAMMKRVAELLDDLGGVGTVGGTADAITVTSAMDSLAAGKLVAFKAGSANTGAATLNVNSLGAKAIRRKGDAALSAGDLAANGIYVCRYDTSYNSAAGAWVLLTPESAQLASASDWRAGTSTVKVAGVANTWDAADEVTLTDASTVAVDFAAGINFTVTLTDNRTLGNPTNVDKNQSGYIRIVQDGGGTNTLAYGSNWEFAGGAAPVLSTGGGDEDMLFYQVISATRILGTLVKDIS